MAGRVIGRAEIMRNLRSQFNNMENRVGSGLRDSMRIIAAVADPRTPEKTGKLKRNKRITVRKSRTGPKASIRYREPYAGTQHERTDFKHPRGGQAKFLQTSADDNRRRTLDILKKSARVR